MYCCGGQDRGANYLMQEVQKCVFIMNLNLALFLEDVTQSVRIYSTDTKKTVKGGHKITIKMATMLDGKDIQLVPGFQPCCSCLKKHKHIVMMYLKWKIMILP